MKKLLEYAQSLLEEDKPFAIATIIEGFGSMPRKSGAKMLVCKDGSIFGSIGGGVMEADIINRAHELIGTDYSKIIKLDLTGEDVSTSALICGGHGKVEIVCYSSKDISKIKAQIEAIDDGKLYILGAGHVSVQIARVCDIAQIEVSVIDDRAEFVNKSRFPRATCILLDNYENIPALEIKQNDMIAIVTRGHLYDRVALRWALGTKASYIGMIGSKKKKELIYEKLQSEGISLKELSKVISPIGLNIGAQTPEEIAVAIVAQLIAHRAKL